MRSLIKLAFKESIRSKLSFVVIAGMIFSLVLPMSIITVSETLMENATLKAEDVYGEFSDILYDAQKYDKNLNLQNESISILDNDNIKKIGTISNIARTKINDENVILGYMDNNALELAHVKVIKGKMPQAINEIALTFSTAYKLYGEIEIGSSITLDGQDYILSGIIGDYFANWLKPSNNQNVEIPNALVSLLKATESNQIIASHLLIDNTVNFNSSAYKNTPDLVRNINQLSFNNKGDYKIKDSIIFLLFICSFLLNYYIMNFYFNKQKKNTAILRCLCINKPKSGFYLAFKIIFLSIIAIIFGLIIGILISFSIIEILKHFIEIKASIIISQKCIIISIASCLIAIIINSIIQIKRMFGLEPIEYLFNNSIENNHKHVRKKPRKLSLVRLVIINFKSHYTGYITSILLFVFGITLFNYFDVYMNMYTQRKSEVEGRMLLNFDYEFTTNQTITDYSYVEDDGSVTHVTSTPTENNTIFTPDYSKIISNDIINEISSNEKIENCDFFLEATNIMLLNYNKNEYITNYNMLYMINRNIENLFNYSNNTMSLHACGYDTKTLKGFNKYVADGSINIDKIINGEEVIVMAPIYEKTMSEDGCCTVEHISPNDYTSGENQFKDTSLHVGDKLIISQLQPDNVDIKGYISEEQAQKHLKRVDKEVKIGAIIYQRVGWFDNPTTIPTAYTILCHNDTFNNLGIRPTNSRLRMYLKPNISFTEFENEINGYCQILSDYNFRNNAIEMNSYREYKFLLTLLYSVIIGVLIILLFGMLFIQNRIYMFEKRRYFALLKINGVDNIGICKYLLFNIMILSILSIVIALPVCQYVINKSYCEIWNLSDYYNKAKVVLSSMSIFIINIISIIPSMIYLKKTSIADIMKNE